MYPVIFITDARFRIISLNLVSEILYSLLFPLAFAYICKHWINPNITNLKY